MNDFRPMIDDQQILLRHREARLAAGPTRTGLPRRHHRLSRVLRAAADRLDG